MLQDNESKRKNQIVNFLDTDCNKISFGEPKRNKHGYQINILYNGESHVCTL